jgi:hypothetical protein
MSKKEITYTGLVKVMLDKARKEADAAGADFDQKLAFKSAAARWKSVKDGSDAELSPGKAAPVTRKRKAKKSRKNEDDEEEPLPGHKGAISKTRPGHIDYRTHKGDKYYNRDGHRQTFNEDGVEGAPYSHYMRHPKTAADVLKMVDLCDECRAKIEAVLPKKGKKATRAKGKKRGGTRKARRGKK